MADSQKALELGQKKFERAKLASELRRLERQSLGCTWERLATLKQAIAQQQVALKRLDRAIERLEAELKPPGSSE